LREHLQHSRLRPLKVVDDNNQRVVRRNRLEVLMDTPAKLHGDSLGWDVRERDRCDFETQEQREPVLDRRHAITGKERGEPSAELCQSRRAIIRGLHTRVFADDVHERPVRDPGAIRQASSPQDAHAGLLRETLQDLRDQPGFADARVPDDGHDVPGAFIARSAEGVQQRAVNGCWSGACPALEVAWHRR